MLKKFGVIIGIAISGILLGACVHNPYSNNITSEGRKMSRAPAEFVLETEVLDLNPENLTVFEVNGEVTDCDKLNSRTEIYQGKSYIKYDVTSTKQLSCTQIKEMKKKAPSRIWKVKKTKWDQADEAEFKAFLKALGDSGCNTTDKCLSGPSNILRTDEDLLVNYYTDCADWPYYLRAYYAYKKNLPISFVLEITRAPYTEAQQATMAQERAAAVQKAMNEANGDETAKMIAGDTAGREYDIKANDLRYSRNGNVPVARFTIPPSRIPTNNDIDTVAAKITDRISSGFLRMTSAPDGFVMETDFYSPKVRPGIVGSGTVLYNVSGHVAIVYDVTAKGEAKFIDAHPDNSITRGQFNLDYKVLKPAYGGNFKNFRPIQVIDPVYDNDGNIATGRIIVAMDSQIPEYSLEQYIGDSGTDASGKAIFKLEPTDRIPAWDFVEWTKYRLSNGAYRLEPVVEMKKEVDSLCSMVKNRIEAMHKGTVNGIAAQPHPYTLPKNIWGSDGDWESYSSPGSDIRLRNKMLSIPDMAKIWMQRVRDKVKNNDRVISYNGVNLKADLIAAYKAASASCNLSYVNSLKVRVPMTLETVISRASLLSFDPYHCIEARWGATSHQELASCMDNQEKRDWYKYQQFLRNLKEKNNNAVHGYTLDQLRQKYNSSSEDNSDHSAHYNILTRLNAL